MPLLVCSWASPPAAPWATPRSRLGLYVVCIENPDFPARTARVHSLGDTYFVGQRVSELYVGDNRTFGAAADLEVFVNLKHPARGQLALTLEHPDGTTVTLKDADAGTAADLFVEYSHNTDTSIKVAPAQSFSAFAGKSAQGTWKLKVADNAAGEIGDLLYWRITVR